MEQAIEFLRGFNVQTIISLFLIMLYFSHHIEGKISKLESKIDQQSQRSDRLYEMFIDLLKERNQN
jgi:cell division protein FtsL